MDGVNPPVPGFLVIIGSTIFFISCLFCLFYSLKLLFMAFKESVLWGLAYLFIPFASLVFIVTHWYDTKEPTLKSLLAMIIGIIGISMPPFVASIMA